MLKYIHAGARTTHYFAENLTDKCQQDFVISFRHCLDVKVFEVRYFLARYFPT